MEHYRFWLEGLVLCSLVMALVWFWQMRFGTPAVVDMVWSLATSLLATSWILLELSVVWERRWLLMLSVVLWGLRLSTHLARRLWRDGHDGRYDAMSEAMGDRKQSGYFVFYQLQALGAFFCALSPYTALIGFREGLRLIDWFALGLWLVAFVGVTIADNQLSEFRRKAENSGKVCNIGLWRYSRHPNYFFEWLIWISWAVMAIGGPMWWISTLCAMFMLVLLTRFTGIPHVEAQSIRSRGDAYERYRQTTSPFIPWFPRITHGP